MIDSSRKGKEQSHYASASRIVGVVIVIVPIPTYKTTGE